MKSVMISGWNTGFDKVGLTKLLRYSYGYSLTNAKAVTDAIMDGESVNIEISDDRMEELVSKLEHLGVKNIKVNPT